MPYPKGRHGRSKWGRRRKFRRGGPSFGLGLDASGREQPDASRVSSHSWRNASADNRVIRPVVSCRVLLSVT